MKILLCCPYPLSLKLGGAKVYIEMAQAYREQGAHCDLVGIDQIPSSWPLINITDQERFKRYPEALKDYILSKGSEYDVIEYEHAFLPYERSLFPPKTLMVARSILLLHHFGRIPIPTFPSIRGKIGALFKNPGRKKEMAQKIALAQQTCVNADLINVPNRDDKQCLVESGIDGPKILVAPYGLSPQRQKDLGRFIQEKKGQLLESPRIAFVGTFDNRKGAVEFPKILQILADNYPGIKLILMGTSAMFKDKEAVFNYFPLKLHQNLEVREKFEPEELPELLKDCCLGIFPSYLESFGFGVLEMLASGIPVAAYNTPGPPIMLPQEWLAKRGDYRQLVRIIRRWLDDVQLWQKDRERALVLCQQFSWPLIARETLFYYSENLKKRG